MRQQRKSYCPSLSCSPQRGSRSTAGRSPSCKLRQSLASSLLRNLRPEYIDSSSAQPRKETVLPRPAMGGQYTTYFASLLSLSRSCVSLHSFSRAKRRLNSFSLTNVWFLWYATTRSHRSSKGSVATGGYVIFGVFAFLTELRSFFASASTGGRNGTYLDPRYSSPVSSVISSEFSTEEPESLSSTSSIGSLVSTAEIL